MEFFFVGVEEQRVDDFVDVLDARVVHAARAARGRVQRALEDGAEDGRGDLAPVEVAGVLEDEAPDFLTHRRHGDALGEEAAVDVGKGGESGLEEGIARLRFLVEHLEEVAEGLGEVLRAVVVEVVVEHVAPTEDAGVLGVEAEYEAHAELVEVLGRLGFAELRRAEVEGLERGVEAADELARALADFHLLRDVAVLHIDHELEAVGLICEMRELDELRRIVWPLHVEYLELAEVAGDDPARALGVRERRRVALCLLGGLEERAVALPDGLFEVDAAAFLLDHRVRRGDHDVDEARVAELYARLEAHEARGVLDAVYFLQKLDPEPLAVLFLVALSLPFRGERRRRALLSIHRFPFLSFVCSLPIVAQGTGAAQGGACVFYGCVLQCITEGRRAK